MRPGARFGTAGAVALGALCVLGCASGAVEHAAPAEPTDWECPARAKLSQGFDPPSPGSDIQLMDRVLVGLSLASPRRSERWMLDLSCVGSTGAKFNITFTPSAPGTKPVELSTAGSLYMISVLEAVGTHLGTSIVMAPTECLSHGFVGACVVAGNRAGDEAPVDVANDPEARGYTAMLALLETIKKDKVLEDVLWKVVDKPGLWTFLTTWSTTVSLSIDFRAARREVNPLEGPWGSLPAWSFAFELTYGGTPLLRGRALATEPRAPLALTGGIIAMQGERASDPQTRFELRVLAARRMQPAASSKSQSRPTS